MKQKTTGLALVTGASSGIGLELARCLANDGHDLIITAEDGSGLSRAAAELRAAGAPRVETIIADLTQPGAARRIHIAVKEMGIVPDFLVNNAGIGVHGDFARETDLARELSVIQVNVVAVMELSKLIIPDMVARGSGKVLISSSVAALAPAAKLSVYSGTKAFDFAFAEALANELQDTGVTVTALLPDATDTAFFERAGAQDTELARGHLADPADIAKAGYSAMMKGADHVVAPFKAKISMALTSVLPERMITKQARAD